VVSEQLPPGTSFELRLSARGGSTDSAIEQFCNAIRESDFSQVSQWTDEVELLNFLADSVQSARYWQDPDEIDRILADPLVAEELRAVADVIASAPASAWWSSAMPPTDQVFIDWHPRRSQPPTFEGTRTTLRNWQQGVLADEAMLRGSSWWSPPIEPSLAETTRHLPNLGAVALLLQEDGCGDIAGDCWTVRCRRQPRVCEVSGAKEWIELVERYALEVSSSRADAWRAATGLDGRWFIPDWSRVGENFDAVHLSIGGYLSTSGRALLLGEGKATFLAGWDPDKSFWLTDILELSGSPVEWASTRFSPSRAWQAAGPDEERI
jgi:hypothetical protein